MPLFYMSFADDDRFLGGTVVEAPTVYHCSQTAWKLGINPGGQISIVEIPAENLNDRWVALCRDRLVSKEEMATFADLCDGNGETISRVSRPN